MSGKDSDKKLNQQQFSALLHVLNFDVSERNTSMLMDAGILMRESVIDDVQSAAEDAEYVIKNNVIDNANGGKENDKGNKFQKKLKEVFYKIKSD
ncbi:hypothetical protein ACFFJN_18615 [Erwinia mallotivora]|uniref:hypothetical protein n=1 Tax=Erwinia mallotivora TaxID=69222 RepID=UPI0035EB4A57